MPKTTYRRYNRRPKSSGSEGLVGLLLIFGLAMYSHGIDIMNAPKYAVVVGLVVLASIGIVELLKRLKSRIGGADVSQMSGLKYEKYVANRLRETGFTNIRLTEKYDLGVDI